MSEIFDRFMRVFITELGGIESQDDTEFLVTGNSNTNAIYLYIPKSLGITLVRVSFTRNDGFTISDYQMNVNEGLADETYTVYEYIFKNNDRVLEVGGRLQISFKLSKKTLIAQNVYVDKIISTPITCANVLRSISQTGEVELAQQLYEASLLPVGNVEEALNTHRTDNNNPHKVNATQVKLDGTSVITVAEKFNEVEQEITNVNQDLTTNINQVKTELGNHTNNINNPHKVTAIQVKMGDGSSTVEERITADESQINANYEGINQNKSNIESHKADTNNPHGTTGVNAKIEKSSTQTIKDYVDNGLTNTLQQAKAYADTKQSSKTSFVFETLENFIENVKYTITDTTATLTKIIDEYGTEYPASELQVGSVNIYLREQNVPDYWLSKKQVEVVGVFSPLNFFLPLEAEMDVDLTNYVTYADYATSTKGGVVKVSAENGVKIDSNGQLSINPATAEEIQNSTGNKAITSSNLPNASQTNKGVVKLSSNFEINANGELDLTLKTVDNTTLFGSGNIETSIKLSNTTVSTWVSDTTYTDYPYKATIAATGIASSMVAEVVFDVADAESGNYAPVCETYDGGVYIYSKVNTAITIPTILVVK